MVETDVDYPTDSLLLWTAMGKVLKDTAGACKHYGIGGWRQYSYQLRELKKPYRRSQRLRYPKEQDTEQQIQKRHQAQQAYHEYLGHSRALLKKAEATLAQLTECGALTEVLGIETFIRHAERQIDQIERRMLHGEKIPHEEKVFSLFEPHTRWLSKGKAGVAVELGVATCVLSDQYQFVLHHKIMWSESDSQVAVEMVEQAQARFADLKQCSFDRGFHSADNRRQLDVLLDHNILPKQGRLSKADQERESDPHFIKARRQHAAVESCINGLEHHGLRRCRAHGKDGFERTVALSVVAYNLHRLGTFLQRQEKARLIKQAKREKKQQQPLLLAA